MIMASSTSSILDVIDGEVELMKSAYAEEFEDVRIKDSWKVPRPPEIRIKLGPHHSKGGTLHDHISVTIYIKTSQNYPLEAATIIVESYGGLSSQESSILQEELKDISMKFSISGTVVMMEICQHTENFLSAHARPYSESIYAEMIAGQKARQDALQQEEEVNLKKKLEEECQQRILMKCEVERAQESLKEEARLRKEKIKGGWSSSELKERLSIGENSKPPTSWTSRTTSECSIDSSTSDDPTSTNMTYYGSGKQEHHISLQDSLGQRSDQNCFVASGLNKATRERCVVYTWLLRKREKKKQASKQSKDYQMDELLSKVNNIEKEVGLLLHLQTHKNLVSFMGFKVSNRSVDLVHIHLVQDFVQGLSLKFFLDQKIPLNESLLHHIATDVLEAVSYLHVNNVIHRNLRDSCLFIDHRTHAVRVSDFAIERRCVEAVAEFNHKEPSSIYPQSPGRGGKKCDIFRIGIVLLSLIIAERVNEVLPTLPSSVSSDLRNFLNRCIEIAEHQRWTAQQLLQHPFISQNSSGKTLLSHDNDVPMTLDNGETDFDEPSSDKDSNIALHLPSSFKESSRLNLEYNILEMLGKGGFGHVYKVRNKVDDRVYALKRIPLHHHSDSTRRKMTREVKLLSSLNHENVVRYFTSWIESFTQNVNSNKKNSADTIDGGSSSSFEEEQAKFIESDCEEEEEKDWLMFSLRSLQLEESESDDIVFVDSNASECQDVPDFPLKSSSNKSALLPQFRRLQYLNIQMEYCEKNTLRQAIDRNLCTNEDRVWRLFIEMTSGLDYIHSQGLIHRDLKPGNIFLDSSDHVKIGDFGLATVAFKGVTTSVNDNSNNTEIDKMASNLTGHVGTTFYIAPEITRGLGKVSYNNKVDIYSLGIIFFEMNVPLPTGMERVKTLTALRLPDICFPDDFDNKEISESKRKLIEWLLNHDASKRPATGELLKSSLVPPPTEEKQKFMTLLETKIQNERSQDYQDILNLLFKPCARPELEATFEVDIPKLTKKQLFAYDLVRSLVSCIFKSYGGMWIPLPFYIPKGSFYQDEENIVSLMSKGGELITSQFELRYPLARYVAHNEVKLMRRYSIDRVQRAHKTSGIHPAEIYECAFDIIGPRHDLAESCARVVLIAQDILLKISKTLPNQIMLKLYHYDLVKVVLDHCGIDVNPRVISLLKDFRGNSTQLECIGECLFNDGVSRNSVESLKAFLLMSGSIEDITTLLEAKFSSCRRKQFLSSLKRILTQLRQVVDTCKIMGVKFEIVIHPMMLVDQYLYQGIAFRLVPQSSRHKSSFNILAQGGSYDLLIQQQRAVSMSSSKKCEAPLSAVGISLRLDRIVASLDTNKTLTPLIELHLQFQGQNNSEISSLFDVFICAMEQSQLQHRVELCSKLRNEHVNADHGFATNMVEAESLCEEFWYAAYFVFLGPNDKLICRSYDNNLNYANRRVIDRKLSESNLVEYLVKQCKYAKGSEFQSPTNFKRDNSKQGVVSCKNKIRIEYVTRKQAKYKDVAKTEPLINEDVMSCVSSRWSNISADDSIEVLAVDLDVKALLCLGQLDVDSTVRNFNESVQDIKSRLPEMKDYIDRICAILSKKIFYCKKNDRPSVIVCYSIPSETLKRII